MMNEVLNYFHHHVVTAFRDYAEARDRRKSGSFVHMRAALNASIALFHFRDHLPAAISLSRTELETQCAAFVLVGDVANVAKHAEINNKTPHGLPLITEFSQLVETQIVVQLSDNEGRYQNSSTAIHTYPSSGNRMNLDDALDYCYDFWLSYLSIKGASLTRTIPRLFNASRQIVARSNSRSPDIELSTEVDFVHRMEFYEYDHNSGTIRPIDFTGQEVRFTISDLPKYEAELKIQRGEVQEIVKFSCTEEEAQRINAATTDSDRQIVLREVMKKNQAAVQDGVRALIEAEKANPH